MNNRYINAIKKMNKSLDAIAKQYHVSKIYFWIDSLYKHIRYGVTPNEYICWGLYSKSGLECNRFYTARHHECDQKKLEKSYISILENKSSFNVFFKDFIKRDWLYCATSSEEQIENFIQSHSKIMVKPINLSSGRGIGLYQGQTATYLKKNKYLLEQFITQHPFLSQINSSSVNTLRIFTLLNSKKQPQIISASLRVGCGGVTDNWHGGGIAYPIDLESGVIYMPGSNGLNQRFIFHPSTGKQMVGLTIPNWSDCKNFVYKAHRIIPQIPLIAWDVVILPEGFELIEGNHNGNPDLMQGPSGQGCLPLIKEVKTQG